MKKSIILIAKDECIMEDTNLPALIIGKEYPVKEMNQEQLIIEAEDGKHYFDLDEESSEFWENYFNVMC